MENLLYIIFFALPLYPAIKTVSKPKSKVCPKCGSRLQGDYEVCSVCGRYIGSTRFELGTFFLVYLIWAMVIFGAFLILMGVFGKIFG